MIINRDLVRASTRRLTFKPADLAKKIGDGDRSKNMSVQQRAQRYRAALTETQNPVLARSTLERVISGNDLVGINYLSRGLLCARSVCRLHLRTSLGQPVGFGTGFLIAPGVVMTNWHVLGVAADASTALAEFDFELDVRGNKRPIVSFALEPARLFRSNKDLDYAVVAVAPRSIDGARSLADFGWLQLNPAPKKGIVGEYLTIIQHPGGEMKQICVRENKLLKYEEAAPTVWYATDTVAGSSGSPAFNNSWEVVALHHSGVPKTDSKGRWLTVDNKPYDSSMDESRVQWIANEGIRISAICGDLQRTLGSHPLVAPILRGDVAPLPERADADFTAVTSASNNAQGAANSSGIDANGDTVITIPLRVAMRLGGSAQATLAAATQQSASVEAPSNGAAAVSTSFAIISAIESVDVDQSNYAKRTGYNASFLGTKNKVPLPKPTGALAKQILKYDFGGKTGLTHLPYWTYSVLMHKTRKLAIFAAGNVDDNKRPGDSTREGDRWYEDTRIATSAQVVQEFYGNQTTFEADRTKNPFDRGHLVRRMDAQWGDNPDVQKRNGDDSFHFTNCTPQHWQFNQGAKRWLGLEDYVIETFAADTKRACVLNGPVFDAPFSKRSASGQMIPQLGAPRKADPTFGPVAIPKLFWKVVACVRANGKLGVAAFIMSQEDFLADTERLKGFPPIANEALTEKQARLFQVKLADLGRFAQLDFGTLVTADTKESLSTPVEIGTFEDIRVG